MTMIVGYIWGTRYSRTQVFSVVMLTFGVVLAAMADAQSKVCNPFVQSIISRSLWLMRSK